MNTQVLPATMRALTHSAYGPPSVLSLVPVPEVGAGDVQVRMCSALFNFADLAFLTGEPLIGRLGLGIRAPRQPVQGRDLAGEVVAVGSAVNTLAVGDPVMGEVTTGSFAEYVVTPANTLIRVPEGLGVQEAGSLPLAGVTALQAVRPQGSGRARRCWSTERRAVSGPSSCPSRRPWG